MRGLFSRFSTAVSRYFPASLSPVYELRDPKLRPRSSQSRTTLNPTLRTVNKAENASDGSYLSGAPLHLSICAAIAAHWRAIAAGKVLQGDVEKVQDKLFTFKSKAWAWQLLAKGHTQPSTVGLGDSASSLTSLVSPLEALPAEITDLILGQSDLDSSRCSQSPSVPVASGQPCCRVYTNVAKPAAGPGPASRWHASETNLLTCRPLSNTWYIQSSRGKLSRPCVIRDTRD